MEEFISKLAEDPTKLAPLLISLAEFAMSVVSFVLNRQHATKLFKAKQHAEISLNSFTIAVPSVSLIDILRHGEKRLGFSEQVNVDHRASLNIALENVTGVEARDLYVSVVLVRRLRRVRWKIRPSGWTSLAPLDRKSAEFSGYASRFPPG